MVIGVISASIPVNVGVTAQHQATFRPSKELTATPTAISTAAATEASSVADLMSAGAGGAGEIINTKA
ncbi:MAG: hypothetical protein JWR17_1942 [Pseudomonas sp.]|jgi:hypothetical protein|uniref:hypothetical protein n=1 Tax=Pseudomonas sp. TaxID=306 RepID=UPI0026328A8A|nr:hypothetical protein [Pseudomonas sp.]MDB6049196.1 hypothetical protein [Pseudomonas sp.]